MTPKSILQAILIALILAAGVFLRLHPTASFDKLGYDENIYRRYLGATAIVGVAHYSKVVHAYELNQDETTDVVVHPLRMGYIIPSYAWMQWFRCPPLQALHAVAAIAAVLQLLVAGIFAWRAGGRAALAVVLAFVACAPLQICLAQRALVDGVYAFWATTCFWLLWENLRAPGHRGWLVAYALGLCLMVLTKEYAAFAFIGLTGLIVANRWIHFGTVTPGLLVATVIGPAVAVVILMFYAGGVREFIHFYLAFVTKSQVLSYAVKCQEGPWSRYLLDFLVVSPLVLLLAVGRMFQLKITDRTDLYCLVFLACCYVPMASVTGGMSLRFAAFWDLPFCWLACSHVNVLAEKFSARHKAAMIGVLALLVCSVELYQYYRIFVKEPVYDPITRNLLHAVDILK